MRHLGRIDKYDATHKMIGASCTLFTDISSFYPSVYTHAIDWAVRGKERAKRDRSPKSVGGKLDQLLRKERGGQTVGISIGPDTSWLVSEILLCRVDAELVKRLPGTRSATRWVDDMVYYAPSQGSAEEALGIYEQELATFGLSLNPLKTRIAAGVVPIVEDWLVRLRQARYREDTEAHQADDIVDLFSTAFSLHPIHPGRGVISYAIKRCNPFPSGMGWRLYEDFVLTAMGLEPSCLRHAYEILHFAKTKEVSLDLPKVSDTCNRLISRHARLGHGYEVSWLLTILRDLGIPPDPQSTRDAAEMSDNMSRLLAWEACLSYPAINGGMDLNKLVKDAEDPNGLESENWLFSYEARARGWCRGISAKRDPAWWELQSRGVRFLVSPEKQKTRTSPLRRMRAAFAPAWAS